MSPPPAAEGRLSELSSIPSATARSSPPTFSPTASDVIRYRCRRVFSMKMPVGATVPSRSRDSVRASQREVTVSAAGSLSQRFSMTPIAPVLVRTSPVVYQSPARP